MSDKLKKYRKEMFEYWIRQQINAWLFEYDAWDDLLEDGEFDEDDWEYIKTELVVNQIVIGEVDDGES